MSTFLIVRHAQSTWNAIGRWQGQADPPLSEEGEALAAAAAGRIRGDGPFDLVITSDLARARRTAELLARPHRRPTASPDHPRPLRVLVEPGLREFHVGEWSGLTRIEIEDRWPGELQSFDAGRLPATPGGESRAGFDARVRAAADRVAKLIHTHRCPRTLIVTHGGVIRSLARQTGLPERHVPNLAGYTGTAGRHGLQLLHPVDLRDERSEGLAGPVAL